MLPPARKIMITGFSKRSAHSVSFSITKICKRYSDEENFKDRTSILRVIRSKEALSALQITAFQFNDYKMAQPAINRILIYDPDYHWSPECESLARSPEYFEFSAPYQETERIHDYLLSSRAPRSTP